MTFAGGATVPFTKIFRRGFCLTGAETTAGEDTIGASACNGALSTGVPAVGAASGSATGPLTGAAKGDEAEGVWIGALAGASIGEPPAEGT
jgi:hypothetical protein